MHIPTVISLLALTAPIFAGSAIIQNLCSDTIYSWSVASNVSAQHTITPYSSYSEPLHTDPISGGIALKVSLVEDGLVKNAPLVILAYAWNATAPSIYYDLSSVFGEPFKGKNLRVMTMSGGRSDCPTLEWIGGSKPDNAGTAACFKDTDLTLTVCY